MARARRTKIRIELTIKGDPAAAFEAIDRALDAGTIQDAIVSACEDDDDMPNASWDIVRAVAKLPAPRMRCNECGREQKGDARVNICEACGKTCTEVRA